MWTRALVGADLGPTTKLTGLVLSIHARRAGGLHVHSTMTRLAAETGLPHREVRRSLEVLVAAGWLQPLDEHAQPRPLDLSTAFYVLTQPCWRRAEPAAAGRSPRGS